MPGLKLIHVNKGGLCPFYSGAWHTSGWIDANRVIRYIRWYYWRRPPSLRHAGTSCGQARSGDNNMVIDTSIYKTQWNPISSVQKNVLYQLKSYLQDNRKATSKNNFSTHWIKKKNVNPQRFGLDSSITPNDILTFQKYGSKRPVSDIMWYVLSFKTGFRWYL